jgi:hypothetical protein
MPLDPSIIANSMSNMAANMPDVNALMQQRVQGMENIYKIQMARQEQAKLAEKEAAQKAAEAMLPAVATAFSDPSDTGLDAASSQLPPEIASAFAPFLQRIKAIPDLKLRKSLLRAELAKDDEGRFILGQLEPSANMQLQAATAAQSAAINMRRLTLDEQKQALEERGEGAWELKEGVDENGALIFVWANPRTKQIIPADLTGAASSGVPGAAPGPAPTPAPLPSTDLVTPRQPVPGAPQVAPPISVAQPPAEQPGAKFRPKPKKEDEMTQEERRRAASVRYAVKNVEKVLQTIDKDPASFGQGADEFALSLIPFGAGEDFKSFVQDANREQVYYRMNQTVATLLRLATGAAFTTPELVTEASSFMPKFGDDPATARDKLDALQDRVISEVGSTGRGFTPEDQAELNALLGAFETMKNKLYPEEAAGGGDLPEGTTSSNW